MSYTIFLPSYSVGPNPYALVEKICAPYGKKAVLIGGKTALEKAMPQLKQALVSSTLTLLGPVWYGGESSYENIEQLQNTPEVQAADMIFAMGGGRCIDSCKVLAERLNKPIFTFPTIASNCASTTAVAVIYDNKGVFKELSFQKKPATHCFIHTEVLAQAPPKFLWAGIGDALSKQYECAFSARGRKLDHTNALGEQISRSCAAPLLAFGAQALTDCKAGVPSEAIEQVALTIIVSTGLTSVLVENNYNSNLAHSVYYSCTVFKEVEQRHLHGELVSYGTLVLLTVDQQLETLQQVRAFNRSIGLPLYLADISVTMEMLPAILDKLLQTGDIKCSPYPITRALVLSAMQQLEAM